jgi:hypothetical protein
VNEAHKAVRSALRKAGLKVTSRALARHADYIAREEGYLTEEGHGITSGSIFITWIPIHDTYAGHRLPWLTNSQRDEMRRQPIAMAQQILMDAGYTVISTHGSIKVIA